MQEKRQNFVILDAGLDKIYYGPIPEPENWSKLRHLFIGTGGSPFASHIYTSSKEEADKIVAEFKKEGYVEWGGKV